MEAPVHEQRGAPADAATARAALAAVGDDAVGYRLDERLPAVLLPVWTRPPVGGTGQQPLQLHFDLKERFGLPAAVMTGCATTYLAPVAAGDVLVATQALRRVGEERQGRLGTGRDWEIDVEHRNQRAELVGVETWSAFGYRPGSSPSPPPRVRSDAAGGEPLPPLRHQLTAGDVIGAATATREHRPVHLDRAAAREAGLPDVILGTTPQQLWLQRAIAAWVGLAPRLGRLDLRMRGPVPPGTLAVEGFVVGRHVDDHGVAWAQLRLALVIDGRTATTADASVTMPRPAADDPGR